MTHVSSRRTILRFGSLALVAAGAGAGGIVLAQQAPLDGTAPSPAPARRRANKPPAIESELVREFVGAAHGNLDKTRSMLDARDGLLNSTWDWGGGDFEAAIGGAGHMGRRDIAQFLINRGARFDIFVAAMLGMVETVRAAVDAFPEARHSLGPHGIPLMAHAKMGGPEAKEVVKYLESLK